MERPLTPNSVLPTIALDAAMLEKVVAFCQPPVLCRVQIGAGNAMALFLETAATMTMALGTCGFAQLVMERPLTPNSVLPTIALDAAMLERVVAGLVKSSCNDVFLVRSACIASPLGACLCMVPLSRLHATKKTDMILFMVCRRSP